MGVHSHKGTSPGRASHKRASHRRSLMDVHSHKRASHVRVSHSVSHCVCILIDVPLIGMYLIVCAFS
jgi:hypothetical protein